MSSKTPAFSWEGWLTNKLGFANKLPLFLQKILSISELLNPADAKIHLAQGDLCLTRNGHSVGTKLPEQCRQQSEVEKNVNQVTLLSLDFATDLIQQEKASKVAAGKVWLWVQEEWQAWLSVVEDILHVI